MDRRQWGGGIAIIMSNYVDIVTYIEQKDNFNYETDFNQTVRQLLNENGWVMPTLTTAEVTVLEPDMPIATVFFNSDDAKLKVKTAAGVIETIQSV